MSICHKSHEMPLCPKFGQLIIRKIIRIVTTRCLIFRDKNVQNSISAGAPRAPSQTPFEALTALPLIPWLHLRGPISKGRGEKEEGSVNEGEKEVEKRSSPIFTTDRRHWEMAIVT